MFIELKYFAALREELDTPSERFETDATTVAGLLLALRERGGAHAQALSAGRSLRVAVNHVMARPDTPIPPGAEVGIFPPVTGG